jgi:hypothetical protein
MPALVSCRPKPSRAFASASEEVKPFVDAGIEWVCAFDYLPLVGDPADAPRAVQRLIDLCANSAAGLTAAGMQ